MFAKKSFIFFVAVIAIALSFAGCSRNEGKQVVLKGSTTVLPIADKAQEAFLEVHDDITISLQGTGSGDGIRSLIEGTCDIANASRAMKDVERQKAKDAGIAVKEITIAHDMIIPVVNPENPVSEITLEQARGIYTGKISNWKELGGEDLEIVVITRDSSSGTFGVWKELVLDGEDVIPDAILASSNGDVTNKVSTNKKAFGYVGIGYLEESGGAIKGLTVDGITPDRKNIEEFPVARPLFMYVDENKMSESASMFIDYILSPDGQKIVADAGFVTK